jgi:hypothetical protein
MSRACIACISTENAARVASKPSAATQTLVLSCKQHAAYLGEQGAVLRLQVECLARSHGDRAKIKGGVLQMMKQTAACEHLLAADMPPRAQVHRALNPAPDKTAATVTLHLRRALFALHLLWPRQLWLAATGFRCPHPETC